MEYLKAGGEAARVFFEKLAENFRVEPEQPYEAGYSTTNRYFALKGLSEHVTDLINFLYSYWEDPEDSEQEHVYREYESRLNDLLKWREDIEQDLHEVTMDEDLERANEYL